MLSSDELPPGSILASRPAEFTPDERAELLRAADALLVSGLDAEGSRALLSALAKIERLTAQAPADPVVIGVLNR